MSYEVYVSDWFHKFGAKCGYKWELIEGSPKIVYLTYAPTEVLQNGGFQYFFENDWVGIKNYNDFHNAYLEIDCPIMADLILKVIKKFSGCNIMDRKSREDCMSNMGVMEWAREYDDTFYANDNVIYEKIYKYIKLKCV
jgi:Domain of unknown function (DUF4375)